MDKHQDECFVYKAIQGLKLVPKGELFDLFKNNERYFLVTNEKLYTLDKKKIDLGEIDKNKVVIKRFEVAQITHITFIAETDDD